MSEHTPTPWFVSGVRFRMNGGEWQSINRYDEAKKQDENIACVGYDSRTGVGFADAIFIVKAANSHDALVKALEDIRRATIEGRVCDDVAWFDQITTLHDFCDTVLASVGGARRD